MTTDNGSLSISAPFNAMSQVVDVGVGTGGMSFAGKTVTARVMLVSGLNLSEDNPGGVKVYAKSGADFVYAAGAWTNLKMGEWVDVTFAVDAPDYEDPGFSASNITELGVEIATGGTGDYTNAVVHVDYVSY